MQAGLDLGQPTEGMESGKIELGAGSFAQSDSVATRIPFRVQTLQPEAEELPTALESLDGWSWQLGITVL